MITNPRRRGVTLLELLVGVSIMTGIIAGAYLCLHAGFTSQTALDEHMEELQKARVALALMTKDLRHACVWSKDSPFIGMDRALGSMQADNLDFTTHNWSPRAPGEGDICEVSYYVNRNPETGEFGLWRRRDTSPDPELTGGGEREELVSGLRGLRFEYYDGLWWYDSWGQVDPRRELAPAPSESEAGTTSLLAGNLYGLPEAVRISIAFGDPEDETPRGISAAPASEAEAESEAERETSDGPAGDSSAPRVFQTVVHLNLAGRASSSTTLGDSSESTDGNQSSQQTR